MSGPRWLSGDLNGVEPRAELELIRETVSAAVERGEGVRALLVALVQLDVVAGAELLVGPRALAHPEIVRTALTVAEPLETVLPPAGLYRRMSDMAPECLQEIVRSAHERHGDADWVWRLSANEDPPGRTVLTALAAHSPDRAPHRALDHGYVRSVVERAAGGDVASLRALHDRTPRARLLSAVALGLERGVRAPWVAWVAAWHGPDVDPLFARVARTLTHASARAALRRQAAGLPETLSALESA